jgi:sarcosine oxidase subunit gamma
VTVEALRRSPLAHRVADLAAVAGGVTLTELPFLAMVNLRVEPGAEAAAGIEAALGLPFPAANAVSGDPQARAILWLGPDEWLVTGPESDAPALVELLAAAGRSGGSVVDVSANRTTVVLAGPDARNLLEKAITLDLHPRAFRAGRCAQTTFARGHVLLWQTADGPQPAYRLLFRGSFADYFADWLTDAAQEFAWTSIRSAPIAVSSVGEGGAPPVIT